MVFVSVVCFSDFYHYIHSVDVMIVRLLVNSLIADLLTIQVPIVCGDETEEGMVYVSLYIQSSKFQTEQQEIYTHHSWRSKTLIVAIM